MRTSVQIFALRAAGYGIAHPDRGVEKVSEPFDVDSIARGRARCMDDVEHMQRTRENNTTGLNFFTEAFTKLKLEFIPSAANFVLVKVARCSTRCSGEASSCVRWAGMDWATIITVGTTNENNRCLGALKSALGAVK